MSKRDGIPAVPVGFDYSKAVLELRKMMSHEAIAAYCGYEAPSSIHRLVRGSVPSHPQGEALWSLYVSVFGTKPPVSQEQAVGAANSAWSDCARKRGRA